MLGSKPSGLFRGGLTPALDAIEILRVLGQRRGANADEGWAVGGKRGCEQHSEDFARSLSNRLAS